MIFPACAVATKSTKSEKNKQPANATGDQWMLRWIGLAVLFMLLISVE